MRAVVQNIMNGNTSAADSAKKYFGVGKKMMRFQQNSKEDAFPPPTGSMPVSGYSYPTYVNLGQGSYMTSFTIYLNGIVLANASQEYIAETSLHEMWHANMYAIGITSGDMQHIEMLTNSNYLNQTISSLQSQFPNLSTQDAQAIFFNGFGQFVNSSVANRDICLQALRKNNLTENFVNTRAEEYRTGQVGTPKCN